MKVQKVYWSERYQQNRVQQAKQVFSFFTTHQESRQHFWQQAKKQQAWKIVSKRLNIYFTAEITNEKMIYTNVLIEEEYWQWSDIFLLLESTGRYFFKKYGLVRFDHSISPNMVDLFHRSGYSGTQSFEKELSYHTGLVLGGGGAHGAYQIGVWKALKEENLEISLVTGTSVGALNGALVVQDQLAQAIELWQELSTNQVLALPEVALSEDLRQRYIQEASLMTRRAVVEGGTSIAPLEALLEQYLDAEKIKCTEKPQLYTIATKIPEFQETVTKMQALEPTEIADWILASASFYPAMAYRQIDGSKYVDGGYRNNVPVDVAIQQGATEVLIVDVQGPGVAKKYKEPDALVTWKCCSNWSLGGFLVFERQRNQLNIQLGYLEAKKCLGIYQGNWYTFETAKPAERYWRRFLRFLVETLDLDVSFFYKEKFWRDLRNVYKDRVTSETCGLAMLELLAKQKLILPNKVYTVEEMLPIICQESKIDEAFLKKVGQLNASEWLKFRKLERNAKIHVMKEHAIYQYVKEKKRDRLQRQLNADTVETLMYLYLYHLKEEQKWHKNSHMRS
ncbi:patatin-like phospholipase family protein [Enterococcus mundtii]|nr:patatin-like phospholipase family protein [Enterococcus mundtii]AUB53866.1 patatin [Enterococcus mundtii]MZZ59166.1 patatin-like phospholipase family protein [Enterococcus mundtii]MZZ62164.1 patatin-like phospholipase family protein [Enterococcus mundtii]MZZ69244.1 patatin-like phospholipase family protein [Enterococcus mundtii]MZZ97991.1 patatin-like phospholipase family protein [Enterococcus mundtii]